MEKLADAVVRLGKLILQFGRTYRVTRYEDGVTPESDTDHTVMLGIVACAYAARTAPHLDLGKIAQFALVHDLVEVYAGDTDSLLLTAEHRTDKERREREALERIKKEFGEAFPWIAETIEAYESLATPEARFVKTMDKAMPGITHQLNSGTQLRTYGLTKEGLLARRLEQRQERLKTYAADQPEAATLIDELRDRNLTFLP